LAARPARPESRSQRYLLTKIEDGLRTPTNEQRLGIQDALEAAGIVFTNGDEPGVKLKATRTN
jgi:hypothetical protein